MKLEQAKAEATRKSEEDISNYYHVTLSVPELGIYTVQRYWSRESKYYAHKGKIFETEG
jgi:hypothetical protein